MSLSVANTQTLAPRELVPGTRVLEPVRPAACSSASDPLEPGLGSEGQWGGRRAADMPRPPRVLLAEDDEDFRSLLSLLLRAEGYHVVEAEDGDMLLEHLIDAFAWGSDRTLGYDAIITDVLMPGFSGLDVLQAFHRSTASTAVIVMSAFDDARFARSARALGAAAFFSKPLDTQELLKSLAVALDRSSSLVRRPPRKKRASQS